MVVVVGGVVESDGGAEVVSVALGSTDSLGAGVVSTTGGGAGAAARRVRVGAGRGRCVVGVSVGVGVSSTVGSAGAVSAGTRGTGLLTALFVVRGAGQRNRVAITATAAAAPPSESTTPPTTTTTKKQDDD